MKRGRVHTWIMMLVGSMWLLGGAVWVSAHWALPPEVRIEPPGPEVPAPIAAFSGVWAGGAWDGVLPHVLIVEQVSATGEAAVISRWGDALDWQMTRGYTRVQGRIDQGRLIFGRRSEWSHSPVSPLWHRS
jgi:hypothetical protein